MVLKMTLMASGLGGFGLYTEIKVLHFIWYLRRREVSRRYVRAITTKREGTQIKLGNENKCLKETEGTQAQDYMT